jgi:orotate phosphoribosyltransferase
VLVVDDIMTTGGSVFDTIDVVREKGGDLVGVGILVNRSGGNVDFGARTEALLTLDVEKWDPKDCPLCKLQIPITEPGSKSLSK